MGSPIEPPRELPDRPAMRREHTAAPSRPRWRSKVGALALCCVLAMGLAVGCGGEALSPLASVPEKIYFEEDDAAGIPLAVGERFAIALGWPPEVRDTFALGPLRPNADGEVVHFVEMGPLDAALEAKIGSPGVIYVFEVVGEGRGTIKILDAAHRVRMTLRTVVGEEAQAVKRTGDRKTKAPKGPKAPKVVIDPQGTQRGHEGPG